MGMAVVLLAWSARGADEGVYLDPHTQLLWTASDNGSGVSGIQAARYCEDNRLGGYSDWRLPSIDQLQTLVTVNANEAGYHIPGVFRLSGWQWSSTAGDRKGELWALDFGDGARASVLTGDSGLNRALCVRAAPR